MDRDAHHILPVRMATKGVTDTGSVSEASKGVSENANRREKPSKRRELLRQEEGRQADGIAILAERTILYYLIGLSTGYLID
jgi:hypothetical protein